MHEAPWADGTTLADVVRHRAKVAGDRIAYTFLADGSADARSMTWSELDQRARVLAGALLRQGACGQPVLLALPSGLAFVESLFACWHAGAIALPVSLPRHQRVRHRLHGIVADAGARFAIGTTDTRRRLDTDGIEPAITAGLAWVDADTANDPPSGAADPCTDRDDVALLQYTSGSTGAPRGVVVTHANLMQNSALIAQACGHHPGQTIAGWLPLFHDMGLIGLVLQAAFSGARCVFMSPERFLMRPRLWLQMISDYAACSSPAPNFAYDLCVDKVDPQQMEGLDLSCWRNALNGSEPVRGATLDRFASAFAGCGFQRSAFFPCYGLAEATLFVTGPDERRQVTLRSADGTLLGERDTSGHVGCGRAFGDTRLAIVDPQTARPMPAGAVGEIWVAGASIASGYWNNPDATAATFNGRLELPINDKDIGPEQVSPCSNRQPPGWLLQQPPTSIDNRSSVPQGAPRWLRTGDIGFIADGELFITGRLRELIIIAGRNLFPVDLERTAESADAAIAPSGVAAFSVDIDRMERLIIVAEVRREHGRPATAQAQGSFDPQTLRRRIRAAIVAEHEVAVHDVILLCPGALPRTTSGKLSRRNARDGYLTNTLEQLAGAVNDHAAP